MGTSISTFKQQLLAKNGFKNHPLPYDNIYGVEGYFAGMKAAISIITTPKSKLVYSVVVSFDDFNYNTYQYNADQKKELQEDLFDSIRLKLIKKYGSPTIDNISYGCNIKWCYWELERMRLDLMIVNYQDDPTYRKIQVVYQDRKTAQKNSIEEDSDW